MCFSTCFKKKSGIYIYQPVYSRVLLKKMCPLVVFESAWTSSLMHPEPNIAFIYKEGHWFEPNTRACFLKTLEGNRCNSQF